MSDKRKRDPAAQVLRVDEELLWLGAHFYELAGGVEVIRITLRPPQEEYGEWMAVVKAIVNTDQMVTFITAPSLDLLAHLMAAKLANGTCKWREEKPYGE